MRYRYSRWDNTQQLDDLTAEEILDALSDDLIADGDLWSALRRMYRWGDEGKLNNRLAGLQDLLEKLRMRRQQELARHDLGSLLEDIKQRLQDVVNTERSDIQSRLDQMRTPQSAAPDQGSQQNNQGADFDQGALKQLFEKMANKRLQFLDNLPESPAEKLRQLSDYEFMSPEAQAKFNELQQMLQQQFVNRQFQGMQQALQNMTPEDLQAMKEMVRDLNEMLKQKMQGIEPDFQSFKQKHGRFFPPDINSLDELMEYLQKQRAQMESLMNSLSPEQRAQLQQMIDDLVKDEDLRWELASMAAMLEQLMPSDQFANSYNFTGSQPLGLQEAMDLMARMQSMDQLESDLESAQYTGDPSSVDAEAVRQLLGPEAARELEQLQSITQILEDEGLIQRNGDRWELSPKAIRRIGQKALRDIFTKLQKGRFGGHEMDRHGVGGDRTDESKPYEFGDPFLLDMKQTIMNAVVRNGPGTPVSLSPEDFEVYRTEQRTQSSTVLMIDMSRSMMLRGLFFSAKKVALALDSLIRGQFPRDHLYIVGFAYIAREMKPHELPSIMLSEYEYGTNLEHGLMLARKLLSKESGSKQIIIVTDGEPTAHMEHGRVIFNYPPLRETYAATLAEVKRCTKENIVINTFMLDRSPYLSAFVDQMTKLNKGRAFYATPERLGEYVLVDYVNQKRKFIR